MISIVEFLAKKHQTTFDVVDLDLPSGIKWASCNIGAKKPEEVGLFFLWGQINGYEIDKMHENFIEPRYLKSASGKTYKDGNVLDAVDDAANHHSNGHLRMPTKEEIEELVEHTDFDEYKLNGVKGLKIMSKEDPNKFIFIPETDFYWYEDGNPTRKHNGIRLWGSTCARYSHLTNQDLACMFFLNFGTFVADESSQSDAYPIRGVLD